MKLKRSSFSSERFGEGVGQNDSPLQRRDTSLSFSKMLLILRTRVEVESVMFVDLPDVSVSGLSFPGLVCLGSFLSSVPLQFLL